MTRAFNRAISGLSESNTATYGQVFLGERACTFNDRAQLILAIVIMYLLFLFLFGDHGAPLSHTRAIPWQAIHLPLHFCLLLLLSAMVVSYEPSGRSRSEQ
jgi:hypothetical protein